MQIFYIYVFVVFFYYYYSDIFNIFYFFYVGGYFWFIRNFNNFNCFSVCFKIQDLYKVNYYNYKQ